MRAAIKLLVMPILFGQWLGWAAAEQPVSPEQVSGVNAENKPAPDKAQLERRLHSVATLLEKSSAARQVDASADQAAIARRERARELHRQAVAAFNAGDLVQASGLLDQAVKQMMNGVRLAAPEQLNDHKKQRDFDNRMESVKALRSALDRINQEKHAGAKGDQVAANIDSMVSEAARFAAANSLDRAKNRLDQAYLATKLAIERLRNGDTLVRTLKFESKQDEYRYELDRNDTHQMLVKLLLQEKHGGAVDSMVGTALDAAARLRKTGEESAARGDYDSAIRTLEQSTGELVKAIRNAGIYIPG